MNKHKNNSAIAYHKLILAAVLWGLAPYIYKQSLLVMTVIVFLAGRYFFGSIALFLTQKHKFKKIPRNLYLPLIIFTILNSLFLNYTFSLAVQKTSVLHIAIISLLTPFLVYIFANIILKERIHKRVIIGGLLAAIGLGYILTSSYANNEQSNIVGDLLMILYVSVNSLVIVWGRSLLSKNGKSKIPAEQLGFVEYSLSALVLLTISFWLFLDGVMKTAQITPQVIIITAMVGVFIGVMPIVLYYRAAKFLPAARLVDTNFISPFVAILTGVVLLGEQVSVSLIIGSLILITGLLISHNKIHPVLIAHRLYMDEKLLITIVRQPKKAYAYISKYYQ
jgi:drug/metabolite transporter (DMT)-like permease